MPLNNLFSVESSRKLTNLLQATRKPLCNYVRTLRMKYGHNHPLEKLWSQEKKGCSSQSYNLGNKFLKMQNLCFHLHRSVVRGFKSSTDYSTYTERGETVKRRRVNIQKWSGHDVYSKLKSKKKFPKELNNFTRCLTFLRM